MRIFRLLGWVAFALLTFVVVAAAGAFAFVQTGPGQRQLANIIEGAVSGPGQIVRIGTIDGFVPSDIILQDVELTDESGVWLSLDRARLVWSPMQLIGGTLRVSDLSAETVTIHRTPESAPEEAAPEETEPGGFSLPELPFDIDVEQLIVQRLALGEAVLGEEAVLTIAGSAHLGDPSEGLDARLSVDRLDGVGGALRLDLAYVPESDQLSLDAALSEPEGGLLAQALGLPGAPPVEITLAGDGVLDDWDAELAGRAGDRTLIEGGANIAAADGGRRLTATVALDATPFAPAGAEALVEGGLDLSANVLLRSDDSVEIDALTLAGAAGSLTASGAIGPGDAAALTLQAALGDSELFAGLAPGVSWSALTLSAEASGPMETMALSAALQGEGVALGDAALDPLLGELTLAGSGAANFTAGDIALERVRLGSPGLALDGALDVANWGERLAFRGEVNAPDLGAFAPFLGQPLAGATAAALDIAFAEETISGDVTAVLTEPQFGVPEVEALLGDAAELALSGAVRLDGRANVERLAIDGAQGHVEAEGQFDGENVAASFTLAVDQLAQLSTDLAGAAAAEGRIEGPLDDLSLTLAASSPELRAAGELVRDLRLTTELSGLPRRPAGEVAVAGGVRGLPLEVEAAFVELVPEALGPLAFSRVAVGLGALVLEGPLTFDPRTMLAEGRLEGSIADFQSLREIELLTELPIAGAGNVSVLFAGAENGRQDATVDLSISNAGFNDVARMAHLDLRAAGSDLLGQPGVDVNLAGTGVALPGGVMLDRLTLDMDGTDLLSGVVAIRGAGEGLSYGDALVTARELGIDVVVSDALSDPGLSGVITATTVQAAGQTFETARFEGGLSGVTSELAVNGVLEAGPGVLAGQPVEQVTAAVQGDFGRLAFDIAALGDALQLASEGMVTIADEDGATRVDLAALSLTVEDETFALVEPTAIAMAADGAVAIDRTVLSAAGGSLAIEGSIGEAYALDAALESVPLSLLGLAAPELAAEGVLDGAVSLEGPAEALAVTVDLTGAGLALGDDLVDPLLGDITLTASGHADAENGELALEQLSLTSPALALDGALDVSDWGEALAFRGAANAPDLSAFAALSGRPLGGAVAADLDFAFSDGAISGETTAQLTAPRFGVPEVEAVLGDAAELAFNGVISLAGEAAIERLAISGEHGDLTAQGVFNGENVSAGVNLALDDVGLVAPELAGAVSTEGTLEGPLDALALDLNASAPSLTAAGEAINDFTLTANLSGLPTRPAGMVSAAATVRNLPLAIDIDVADLDPEDLDPGQLVEGALPPIALENVAIGLGDLSLEGALTLDPNTFTAAGEITGTLADLQELEEFAELPLTGLGDFTLTLRPSEEGGQDADLQLSVAEAALQDLGSAERLEVTASGRDVLGSFGLDLALDATGLTLPEGVTIESLTATAGGEATLEGPMVLSGVARGIRYGNLARIGAVEFNITLDDILEEMGLSGIIRADAMEAAGQRFASAEFTGELTDLLGAPALDGRLAAENGEIAGRPVDRLALEAEGGFDDLAVTLAAEAAALALMAVGRIRGLGEGGDLRVDLAALDGVADGVPVALADPASLTLEADGGLELSPAEITIGDGRVAIAGMFGEEVALTAEMEALPFSLAGEALPGYAPDGSISGALTLNGAAESVAIAGDISGEGIAIGDAALDPLLGPLTLSFNGVLTPEAGDLSLAALTLSSRAFALDGALDLTGWGEGAAFRGSVTAPDLSAFADLSGQSLGGAAAATLDVALQEETLAGEVTAELTAPRFGAPELEGLLGAEAVIAAAGSVSLDGRASVETLTIDGAEGELSAEGDYDGESVAASFALAVTDLGAITPGLAGAVAAEGALAGALDDLTLTLNAAAPSLTAVGEPITDAMLAVDLAGFPARPQGAITASGTVQDMPVSLALEAADLAGASGPITFERVAVALGALELDGAFTVDPVALTLDGALSGAVDDLAEAAAPLADLPVQGGAAITLTMSPDAEGGQNGALTVGLENAVLEDVGSANAFSIAAEGSDLFGQPSLSLVASGSGLSLPGDIDIGRVTLAADGADLLAGELALTGTAGALAYGDDAGIDEVEFDLTIDEPLGDPGVTGALIARNITAAGQTIAAARAEGGVTGLATTPMVDLAIEAGPASFGGQSIASLSGNLTGGLDDLGFSLSANGADLALSADGRVAAGDQTVIDLTSATVTAFGEPLTLAGPTRLTVQPDGDVLLDQTVIALRDGSVTVAGEVGEALALDVSLNNAPLQLVELFAPGTEGVQGRLNGSAEIGGTPTAPTGVFSVTGQGIATADSAGLGVDPVSLSLDGALSGDSVSLAGIVESSFGALIVDGVIPLGDGPLSAQIGGEFDLALLNPFLATGPDRVEGALIVALNIGGAIGAPLVGGTVQIVDGGYVNALYGIQFDQIQATLTGTQDRLVLTELTGMAPNGGQLAGAGEILVDAEAGFPISMALQANDAQLVDMTSVRAVADLDLTLIGEIATEAVLAGTVSIDRVDARLTGFGGVSVVTIEVEERNPVTAGQAARIAEQQIRREGGPVEPATGLSLIFDVAVSAPGRVFVRGWGVDAEFGGALRLSGTSINPVATGELALQQGTFDILGRRLDFSRGVIAFDGQLFNPLIDFEAETVAEGVTAIVGVSGRVNDPNLYLASTPNLPDDEILARLLFGRATGDLSTFEALQLAQQAAALAGIGGDGPGILGSVRDAIGVDRLDITTDDEGEVALGVNQRIAEGVRIGVEQGLSESETRATVEIDLTPNIQLEGAAGTSGSSVGVSMEWDF